MFCLTTSNNKNEFMKYNTGFELPLQTANTNHNNSKEGIHKNVFHFVVAISSSIFI